MILGPGPCLYWSEIFIARIKELRVTFLIETHICGYRKHFNVLSPASLISFVFQTSRSLLTYSFRSSYVLILLKELPPQLFD